MSGIKFTFPKQRKVTVYDLRAGTLFKVKDNNSVFMVIGDPHKHLNGLKSLDCRYVLNIETGEIGTLPELESVTVVEIHGVLENSTNIEDYLDTEEEDEG